MKKNLVFIFLSLTLFSYSQVDKVKKSQFKVNFLAPGIEYEIGLTDRATFVIEAGSGFAYQYSSSFGSDFKMAPYLEGQYRYYYNFRKRASNDKNTLNNSANYISVIGSFSPGYYSFANSQFVENVGGVIGPAWGFQRTYKCGFNLSLDLGVGYLFNDDSYYPITPIIAFQLGWVIDRVK